MQYGGTVTRGQELFFDIFSSTASAPLVDSFPIMNILVDDFLVESISVSDIRPTISMPDKNFVIKDLSLGLC